MNTTERRTRRLDSPRPSKGRVSAVLFLCLTAGAFSLLIWAKLRVVTGIPRSAYADPEQQPRSQPPALKAAAAPAPKDKPVGPQ